MYAKDIEQKLTTYAGGAAFITPGKLAKFMGQANVDRVRKKYLDGVFHVKTAYFIPEVAKNIYAAGEWRD